MKKNYLLPIVLLLAMQSFSQILSEKMTTEKPKYSANSEMKVIYKESVRAYQANNKAAIFVNEHFIKNESALKTINEDNLKNVEIEKGNFQIKGKEYQGKVLIETESGYDPKFISLKAFLEEHLNLDANPVIFQIDGNIINEDYNDYVVDEKYILKVIVQKIKTSDKATDINHIKLITRTAENIKKANQIIIEGTDF